MKVDCESDVGAKEGDALSLGMEEGDILDTEAEYLSPSTGRIVSNQGTHTEYSKYVLSAKVETMVLRNEVATMKNDSKETTKIIANMSYENIKKDSTSMKSVVRPVIIWPSYAQRCNQPVRERVVISTRPRLAK